MTTRWRAVLARLVVVAGAVGLMACGSGSRADGGADGGGDVAVAGSSCQDIRVCLVVGQALDVCVARGTTAAQATFNGLLTCLRAQPMPGCTGTDPGCTCPEECYADGLCLDETAACLDMSAATVDGVCDQYCGG
ncbi:MAG TPA: hypothetical protein VGP07_23785 [Polyangia bacterium]